MDETGRQLVEVQAWQWGFAPEVVRVRAGVPVRIRAESLDVAHSLLCEEMGLDLRVPAKGTGLGEIVFTPERPGEYVIRCGVDCGPARSRMTMTMIVMMK